MLGICAFLTLLMGTALASKYAETHTVDLQTKDENLYTTVVKWTIENFLEMPYVKMSQSGGRPFFKSQKFPVRSEKNVQWYFTAEYDNQTKSGNLKEFHNGTDLDTYDEGFNLKLNIEADYRIHGMDGYCDCSIIDVNNTRHKSKVIRKEARNGSPFNFQSFVTRTELENNEILLPEGDLTIECIINGHLKLDLSKHADAVPTKFSGRDGWLCSRGIAEESLDIMLKTVKDSDFVQVTLSYMNSVRIPKAILHDRVPKLANLIKDGKLDTSKFFTNSEQFRDFMDFLVKGDALNLKRTCQKLFKMAEEYEFDCLKVACNEIIQNA